MLRGRAEDNMRSASARRICKALPHCLGIITQRRQLRRSAAFPKAALRAACAISYRGRGTVRSGYFSLTAPTPMIRSGGMTEIAAIPF